MWATSSPKSFTPHLSLKTPSTPSYPFTSHSRVLPASDYSSNSFSRASVPRPYSQRHLLFLFFFFILTPQLLLPGRIWTWGFLSVGTARICHIPLWGQRRRKWKGLAKRGQQEAKETQVTGYRRSSERRRLLWGILDTHHNTEKSAQGARVKKEMPNSEKSMSWNLRDWSRSI